MTVTLVNTGSAANDGTGDPLRVAFAKINTKFSGWVDVVADFGAIPNDSSTLAQAANDVAFAAAHNSFTGDVINEGGMLFIPKGDFYLGNTWHIEKRLVIQGCGRGQQANTAGTRLIFPTGKTGIRVYANTTSPGGGSGAETTIRNLCVSCESVGTTGHGIWASANVYLENLNVQNFGEDGINIVASSGSTGNANKWKIDTVLVQGNGGNGVFVDGNDANAGCSILIDAKSNGLWGIYDSGKFQNTHYSPHMNGNGFGSFKDANNEGCVWICPYIEGDSPCETTGGSLVIGGIGSSKANMSLVGGPLPRVSVSGDGSGATAKAFVSGGAITKILPFALGSGYSTATVSFNHGSGSGATATATCSGGKVVSYTVTNGGSGYSDSQNGTFLQPTSGGSLGTGGISSVRFDSNSSNLTQTIIRKDENRFIDFVPVGDGGLMFDWDNTSSIYQLNHNSTAGRDSFRVASDISSDFTGGRSAAVTGGSIWFPNGFWLGTGSTTGSTPRQLKYASSMPASGSFARGDFVFNTAPTLDANNMIVLGWSRLTTGSSHEPGTDWKACLA